MCGEASFFSAAANPCTLGVANTMEVQLPEGGAYRAMLERSVIQSHCSRPGPSHIVRRRINQLEAEKRLLKYDLQMELMKLDENKKLFGKVSRIRSPDKYPTLSGERLL